MRNSSACDRHIGNNVKLQQMRVTDVIKNFYRLQRDLFNEIIASFIEPLIYGFFHETFKEYEGTVVLAFLLGLMQQSGRRAVCQ